MTAPVITATAIGPDLEDRHDCSCGDSAATDGEKVMQFIAFEIQRWK